MKDLSRRGFVVAASLAGLGVATRAFPQAGDSGDIGRRLGNGRSAAFNHGVASGDPLQDRVVLWTRVTPKRAFDQRVPVRWLISTDPGMKRDLAVGHAWAEASRDFTVKVDAAGLAANRTYYYQFEAEGMRSPVGRTRTLPFAGIDSLRFAFASCSNYPYGFFHVYRRIAERADLDFVLHLGDYIYEYGNGQYGDGAAIGRLVAPGHEIVSLDDYRQRHATYKTDADLQEAHRQHPFITVWDDHESSNDSWRDGAQNHNPGEGDWQARKQAAIRAYLEWMPIREAAYRPQGQIYRSFRFGDLAEIDMLDTRLYGREQQSADLAVVNDPARQLLGVEQESWLLDRLYQSQMNGVQWKLLGQQVMMGQLSLDQGVHPYNIDQWDGYAAARARLFDHIAAYGIQDSVVLTGDIHSSWAHDLARNPYDPAQYNPQTGSGSLAVELVTPGVTSPGFEDPVEAAQTAAVVRALSPHNRYVELNKRGYVVVDANRERLHAEWWHVPTVQQRVEVQSRAMGLVTQGGANHLVPTGITLAPRAGAADPAP